ncbi:MULTISPECIES: dTDP-4-dehydrorhamnose 3,5-epimerase [unclassified Ruminococcus]|uniref:dTDP-4-dehydrorhamnose 3,5-epimerase n=1 Tax=unclassified Ruminococcus TaxID=2608920 RepID=UPI00210B4E9C|nr:MULTISPECIES: dTDP-4-dehydrorhamnose 3,5-epimerase [unclassified Ruminococcus]MCQ4022561.1 dTDP-4-dehydrorhamnose 3,5-epimerase [Ruminococcus sp. zg-924]MCQ4114801.1 dTDP-4-dehydrorhamnose 3,5-epimerase [Ruminococcus sp. zg-921]
MYTVEETALPEVLILTPKTFEDNRGAFFEAFSWKSLKEVGIELDVKQENHIINLKKGVVRGLHFQNEPHAQAKLVKCISGIVDDVAVDLRKGSPTYLKWVMVELSAENKKQLYLPKGFAHGVISRTEYSEIQYYVDAPYAPESDRNIRFDEPAIGVDWKEDNPVLSPKDQNAPSLAESDCNFNY